MTADNRTNEPTPEQVEAAAKAIYEVRPNGGIEWDSAEFDEWMERGDYRAKARAALAAAQGAAPAPSSGVDEDKLAEVIGRDENYTRDIELGGWTLSPRLAARAVAAWLKGQGENDDE